MPQENTPPRSSSSGTNANVPLHSVPVVFGEQFVKTSGRQIFRGAVIENRKSRAVKTHKAAKHREAEITVAGLQNRIDRVLRQAVVGRPRVKAILRQRRGDTSRDGSGANSVNKAARAQVVSRSYFTLRAQLPIPVAPLLVALQKLFRGAKVVINFPLSCDLEERSDKLRLSHCIPAVQSFHLTLV